MAATCSHENTRLTCVDCNSPICSNCLVECPVGFRCATCNGGSPRRSTPVSSGGALAVAKSFAICLGMGVAAGYALPYIRVPFFSCFLCYIVGMVAGRFLTKVLDHSIGNRLGTIVVFGLLIGMSLTPYKDIIFGIFELLAAGFSGGGTEVFGTLVSVVSFLFCPVLFFAGILRPILWGDRF